MPFRLPTRLTLRPGCFDQLPHVVSAHGARVLLVFDEGLAQTPWPERAAGGMGDAGLAVATFSDVAANPRRGTVEALAALARHEGVEVMVGLGGGSVLDAAKCAAMLARNAGSVVDYEGRNRFEDAPLPMVAVPTTCGTGSEVTWVAVVTHEDERRKMSVKGDGMFPDDALVDADLIATLPAPLVASTGLDALTHAVEAYTCRAANPVSDALAEKAVVLLVGYLARACADVAGDAEAREAVMRASTLAGIAFGNADVAGVHCLSESLGGLYDVPHGLANAVLLAPMLRYQEQHVRLRLAALEALVDAGAPGDAAAASGRFIDRIASLVVSLGLPSFGGFGIPRDDYAAIAAASVLNNSNASNARPMAADDYLEVLLSLGPPGSR